MCELEPISSKSDENQLRRGTPLDYCMMDSNNHYSPKTYIASNYNVFMMVLLSFHSKLYLVKKISVIVTLSKTLNR